MLLRLHCLLHGHSEVEEELEEETSWSGEYLRHARVWLVKRCTVCGRVRKIR